MQAYPLNLLVVGGVAQPTVINADANLFVYESGAATPGTGDTRIRVKPDNGEEMVLRPGQRFRIPEQRASRWNVVAYDGASALAGIIVIGSGEFDDANTLNKVTLDATFANVVTVAGVASAKIANTVAERIPVTLDATQTINTATNVMAYTASYSAGTNSVALTPILLLSAAANVNGVVLNKFDMLYNTGGANGIFTVVAKATSPGTAVDGDVLVTGVLTSGANTKVGMDIAKEGQPKVPAGKAIWYFPSIIDGALIRDALFTVL